MNRSAALKVENPADALQNPLGEFLRLSATLHRKFLESVSERLKRAGHDSLTPTQALMVFEIGGDLEIMQRDLRGAPLMPAHGNGMAYNLVKLESMGLVERYADPNDKRQKRIKLTPKGVAIFEIVESAQKLIAVHAKSYGLNAENIKIANEVMKRACGFYHDAVAFRF